MTVTPSGQIAAVIVGVVGGALLAGKGNRYLGAVGGGTLGLVVPYVIWPPTETTPPVVVAPAAQSSNSYPSGLQISDS